MKKTVLLFVLILQSVYANSQYSCGAGYCEPTDGPYIGCYGIIDRYLARSIFANFMADALLNDVPWEHVGPTEYCQFVNVCTDLNAAYISRAAGLWGVEYKMKPGAPYYNAAAQVITDVNNAYSCARLRRPIVEAAILEYITDDVNSVVIPDYVKSEFAGDPAYAGTGYAIGSTNYFKRSNICYTSGDPNTPDISRITARMWFYYLAHEYLDMGYRGLHMGNIGAYNHNDPNNTYCYDLFAKIRQYATEHLGSFVLINADSYDLYLNNDNHTLLLDFNSSPIRPDETYNANAYDGLPCHTPPNDNAELIFHNNRQSVTSHGGLAPNGCVYDHTPTLFNLDWSGCPGPIGTPNHGGWDPYGYSETSWFNLLSPECQAYWIENIACAIKNDIGHRLYFKIPGIEVVSCGSDGISYPGSFTIMSNPALISAVKNTIWRVNDRTDFTIMDDCEPACGNTTPCRDNGGIVSVQGKKTYVLKVTNPDCNSVYTWHVQRPDGSWLPYTFGNERKLQNMATGLYHVYLRQDNLGFPYPQDVFEMQKDWPMDNGSCCVDSKYATDDASNGNDKGRMMSSATCCKNMGLHNAGDAQVKTVVTGNGKLSDAAATGDFSLYPNPAKNTLNVQFTLPAAASVRITIQNADGVQVAELARDLACSAGSTSLTRSLDNIPSGVYFVILMTGGHSQTQKLTVVR